MKYYFGVYVDYTGNGQPRIAQLAETVDDLNCEMLADPGLITFYQNNRNEAKSQAKQLALRHGCRLIEFQWGKYKLIKIKKP